MAGPHRSHARLTEAWSCWCRGENAEGIMRRLGCTRKELGEVLQAMVADPLACLV
jgi:hypothetical protein